MMSRRFVLSLSGSLLLVLGILIGFEIKSAFGDFTPPTAPERKLSLSENAQKFQDVLKYVQNNYFEEADLTELTETAIVQMLESLDPHTFYIEPPDMKAINEQMSGSFEGIGIQFEILEDTIHVVTPISGGPSDRLGILPGDRIVEIEGDNVAGVGIKNEDVIGKLRGEKGTVVNVSIKRPGTRKHIPFAIERDKIPLNSVDYAYMVNEETGYIKVNRFAESTKKEFDSQLFKLKGQGMKNLILDLRFNPGGYLQMATQMAELFLKRGEMIVYTQGRTAQSNSEYRATGTTDVLNGGGLVVLINQGSASASEIVSGAVQDHDRGLIVGTRSFGKGLVQQQYPLLDGSAVRVVVSRYFTPSGRCIQKPFDKSSEDYEREVLERFESGELFDPTKIDVADSLRYQTDHGRVVYGGGGIIPDVFVPTDTSGGSEYLTNLFKNSVLRQFALHYVEGHPELETQYTSGKQFVRDFAVSEALLTELRAYATEKGVAFVAEDYAKSKSRIQDNLKALIARKLYQDDGFYPALNATDPVFLRALELMPKAIELARTGKFQANK